MIETNEQHILDLLQNVLAVDCTPLDSGDHTISLVPLSIVGPDILRDPVCSANGWPGKEGWAGAEDGFFRCCSGTTTGHRSSVRRTSETACLRN